MLVPATPRMAMRDRAVSKMCWRWPPPLAAGAFCEVITPLSGLRASPSNCPGRADGPCLPPLGARGRGASPLASVADHVVVGVERPGPAPISGGVVGPDGHVPALVVLVPAGAARPPDRLVDLARHVGGECLGHAREDF